MSEARDYNHAEELEICKHIILIFTNCQYQCTSVIRDDEESCNNGKKYNFMYFESVSPFKMHKKYIFSRKLEQNSRFPQ